MTAQPKRYTDDVRILELPVRTLTPEAFAPYGEVSSPATPMRLDLSGGQANLCEVLVEPKPFYLDFLARHVRCTQTYVPLGGSQSVIVVAPPSDLSDAKALPDLTRLAAFLLDGKRAITLHRGTWHRTPMVSGDAAHFMVLDRIDTLDDIDLVDLRGNLGVEIAVKL